MGVEDFESATRPRLLSAVRNIHAGILLLYKEALRQRSPDDSAEVLIKASIEPRFGHDGRLEFTGVGNKTAGIQQIKDRFRNLHIATDWQRFDQITTVRNEIEHYYTTISQHALSSVVANAFMIVRHFVAGELDTDPLSLLGDATWQSMLGVAEVYEAERKECHDLLGAIDWVSPALKAGVQLLSCQKCGSGLLAPRDTSESYDGVELRCRACGADEPADAFIPRAVERVFAGDVYEVVRHGGELPYACCPECASDAYVVVEKRCAVCGHEAAQECARCGSPIPPEELDSSPYCGWCAHMMTADR